MLQATPLHTPFLNVDETRPARSSAVRASPPVARRSSVRARSLAVRSGSDAHLQAPALLAAQAPREQLDTSIASTFWVTVPPAGHHNTEVVWDDATRRLSVAVWSRRVPQHTSERPRMLWYASFWLPEHDGQRASALLHDGVLQLTVPR